MIARIAARIAALYDNLLSDRDINRINDELEYQIGDDLIKKTLADHDLRFESKRGYSKTLYFTKLNIPVRNAYLWVEDGKGTVLKRKNVLPFLPDKMEKLVGPFTEDPTT